MARQSGGYVILGLFVSVFRIGPILPIFNGSAIQYVLQIACAVSNRNPHFVFPKSHRGTRETAVTLPIRLRPSARIEEAIVVPSPRWIGLIEFIDVLTRIRQCFCNPY
jgi:hypothetical protein